MIFGRRIKNDINADMDAYYYSFNGGFYGSFNYMGEKQR